MTNDFNNTVLVFMFLSRLIGIIGWAFVFLLLMEVVICKDAIERNAQRILNVPVWVRVRLFRKSFRNLFYKGSLFIWVCSLFSILSMVTDLWLGHLPRPPYTWTIVSILLPLGIIYVYIHLGYQITFFKKLTLFIKDQHE